MVPEAMIGRNFFCPQTVFLLSCLLKQPKPRHKEGTSLTLFYKAVHIALSFKGIGEGVGPMASTRITGLLCWFACQQGMKPNPDKTVSSGVRDYKRLHVSYKAESRDTNPHRQG